MNKFIENFPFVILLAIVPYFFYKEPSISQAVIALGVCGLAGFSYYLKNKEKPDLEAIFKEQIEARDLEIYNQFQKQGLEIREIKEAQGKSSIDRMIKSKTENFSWNNI